MKDIIIPTTDSVEYMIDHASTKFGWIRAINVRDLGGGGQNQPPPHPPPRLFRHQNSPVFLGLNFLKTEMHMWATVIAHMAENKRQRVWQKYKVFVILEILNICHFYSKLFQEHLLFMIYYSY